MVCGAIGDHPLVPEVGAAPFAGVEASGRSNGLGWLDAAGCEDDEFEEDDFDVANACRVSQMDDAAPRANSMAGLRQTPHDAA
jgi:hypothetical protein